MPGCATTGAARETEAAAIAPTPPGTAIASGHALATEAGLDMIRAGGNAFDAAVAVSSTLSVVEPISSGLGGGGFFLLHDASTGEDVFLDAREVGIVRVVVVVIARRQIEEAGGQLAPTLRILDREVPPGLVAAPVGGNDLAAEADVAVDAAFGDHPA